MFLYCFSFECGGMTLQLFLEDGAALSWMECNNAYNKGRWGTTICMVHRVGYANQIFPESKLLFPAEPLAKKPTKNKTDEQEDDSHDSECKDE